MLHQWSLVSNEFAHYFCSGRRVLGGMRLDHFHLCNNPAVTDSHSSSAIQPALFRVWGGTAFVEIMAVSSEQALASAAELFPGKPTRASLVPEWDDDRLLY